LVAKAWLGKVNMNDLPEVLKKDGDEKIKCTDSDILLNIVETIEPKKGKDGFLYQALLEIIKIKQLDIFLTNSFKSM
jgi:hypothetical protein